VQNANSSIKQIKGQRVPPTKTTVIINAGSGTGHTPEWAEQLTDKFRACGMEIDLTLASDGTQMIETAQRALTAKSPIIVAGGGDGTLNAVASVVSGTDVTLGVLPLGTLNHFAKDLRIPLELDDAIRTIAEGNVRQVDVGAINDRIFLNNSSLGLYPDIVRSREKQQRLLGRGKWHAFFWASIAVLRRYPFIHARLKVEGVEHARRTPFIFVGNNAYLMEGLEMGTRARLDAGVLSLCVAHRTGRLGLLRLAFSALLGRLRAEKEFDALITEEVEIDTHHKRLPVSTDGEVTLMGTPLHYSIRKAALRVIAPNAADAVS
jgi:diacylglycerol kinase family enzyme